MKIVIIPYVQCVIDFCAVVVENLQVLRELGVLLLCDFFFDGKYRSVEAHFSNL